MRNSQTCRSLRFSTLKENPRQIGLTLVELLVAISILGLVAMMGWRGLDSIIRTRTTLNAELEQTRGMQLAFAQLQSDCAQLVNATTLPNRVPLLTAPNKLTLIRSVYADNQPTRLQVVSYRVMDGRLTRRESPATRNLRELDTLWQAATNDTDTGPAVLLQSQVATMSMRVWLNGIWQLRSPNATPTGLEVVLQLQGNDTSLIKTFLLGAV